MKVCKNCQQTLPISSFYLRGSGSPYTMCKGCYNKDKKNRAVSRTHSILESKICRECGEEKPADEFHKNYSQQGGLASICKDCAYLANLATKYKINNIDELISERNGLCDICKNPFGKRPYVDHDHTCCASDYTCGNCFRGLLCGNCNTGLGMFSDSLVSLSNAINYIATYNSNGGNIF